MPSVQTTATDTSGSDITSHTVTMPSGYTTGDLVVVAVAADGGDETVTWPAGWNEIRDTLNSGEASIAIAYRQIQAGDPSTITATLSGVEQAASISWRITGHEDPGTQAPEASTGATGNSTTPDPDTVTPTGGSKAYLFLATAAFDRRGVGAAPTAPSGYSNLLTPSTGAGGGTVTCFGAEKEATASSDNPGTFDSDQATADGWVAVTVAIHPAAGGGGLVVNVADTVTASDVDVVVLEPLVASASEAVTAIDVDTVAAATVRITALESESVTVTDVDTVATAGVGSISANVSETVTVSDVDVVVVTPLAVSVSESVAVSDVDTVTSDVVRVTVSASESVTVSDVDTVTTTSVGAISASVSDTVTATDVDVVVVTPLVVSVSESVAAADVDTVAVAGAAGLAVSASEPVTVSDVDTATVTTVRITVSVSESVTTAEDVRTVVPLIVSLSEAVTATDAETIVVAPLVVSTFEGVTVTDVDTVAVTASADLHQARDRLSVVSLDGGHSVLSLDGYHSVGV